MFNAKAASIDRSDFNELVFCHNARKIAKTLANNEVVLLSAEYKAFFESAITPNQYVTVNISEVPCKRWFISKLNHYFREDIAFACKHACFGTMIYHKNCDLLNALSLALGRQTSMIAKASKPPELPPNASPSIEQQVKTVASHLNAKLHKQSQEIVKSFMPPENYLQMNLTELIKEIDPVLLDFLQQVTSCKTKRRKSTDEIKSIRHLYAFCVLLFNTNNACSAPLHVVLTDFILCHGGSLELVRIMNRIGAVASVDTCNRLATQVVQTRIQETFTKELVPGMLTVVSIDNIDILQPHAVVSSLDATRSWHGTSVQCMQPLPASGTLNADELVNAVAHSTNRCPELLQCFKRRRRTLTEKVSPHTQTANIPRQVLVENVSYELNNSKPQITDFLLSESDKDTQFQLKLDIHLAVLLKYFNTDNKIQLPAMASLLHCVRKQSVESELSNVVYVEILSEIADSKATLLHIVGKLHKTFLTDLKQKWVLVIGDAKIFDVLQDLRVEYGDNLKWLIPIPGDWHVLYNYHKVLMKPYADAGLINLAKVSGYRAETLTAIRNASNFRHTHLFLLQSFEAVY